VANEFGSEKESIVATITKEVEPKLTLTDIVQAIRALSRQERDELLLQIQRLLIEEDADVLVSLPELTQLETELKPPPPTQEGDREALAAVDDFCGMFPISDPELARWIADSDEAGIFGTC